MVWPLKLKILSSSSLQGKFANFYFLSIGFLALSFLMGLDNRESWQEKERQLRARVKRILPIDVHQPQPLGAGGLAPLPADALVSAFCLEAVSPDLASFQQALDHITTLLRPGGHLLLIGALEESWYLAGEATLAVVPVREEEVREALVRSGYEVRDLRTYTMPAHLRTGVDDVKGIFFTWAQKKVGV